MLSLTAVGGQGQKWIGSGVHLLCALGVTTSLQAETLVTFDGQGYREGYPLHESFERPGLKWWGQAGKDYFEIQAVGVEDSYAAVTLPMPEDFSNLAASLDLSSELGDFIQGASIVEASFQVRYLDPPTGSHHAVAAVWFGSIDRATSAFRGVRIGFQANGRIEYSVGEKRVAFEDCSTTDETSWLTISVRMDYAKKEYSFAVNGNPQEGSYPFMSDPDEQKPPIIFIQNIVTPEHLRLAFDNFSMSILPPE